jgi:virginiamycin B lyase
MKVSIGIVATSLLGLGWIVAPAPKPVEITEWAVPWENTRPRDPYVGPDGRVWFVGQTGDYVGVLDPASGKFERFELDEGTGPHNLIVGADGMIWYAGNRAAHIGRLDPRTGKIVKYPMPDPAVRDPHTLVWDANGDIWFTAQGANFVGKLMTRTGEVRLIPVPTERARPYGIVLDSKGRPWINLLGTNKLATVDPATMQLREIEIPRAEARTRRIGVTSDDKVWYVDYAAGHVGEYDPATGKFREWLIPAGEGGRPYAMAVDDRDRIWFVETGVRPNRFVGFDPRSEEFFSITEIGSGGGTVRHMVFHPQTRTIWFGTDTNTIGRAVIPGELRAMGQ